MTPKSVSEVFAPVSGTIVERNAILDERPELVNDAPYGDGWIAVVQMSDPAELDHLLDAPAYRAFLEEQA